MVAARRAMARMIDTLSDADRFAVLRLRRSDRDAPVGEARAKPRVRHRPESVQGRRVPGEDRVAGRHRDRPAPRPGCSSCLSESGHDRDRILVLVTDGQVGNEDQVLKVLGARLEGNPCLHAGDRPGGQRRVPAPAGRAGAGGWRMRAGRVGRSARRGDGLDPPPDRHAGRDRRLSRASGRRGSMFWPIRWCPIGRRVYSRARRSC